MSEKQTARAGGGNGDRKRNILLAVIVAAVILAIVAAGIFGGGLADFSGHGVPGGTSDAAESTAETPDAGSATDAASDSAEATGPPVSEDGRYFSKEEVALYIHTYGRLPSNFVTKSEAREKGWEGGSVEPYFPGCAIGGDRFGNNEGLLPAKSGRVYYECDIDTLGRNTRGSRRIVFSNDGLVYYTGDHYESFELIYGTAEE